MWLLYLIAIVLGGGSLLVQMFAGGDHGDPGHGLDHGDTSASGRARHPLHALGHLRAVHVRLRGRRCCTSRRGRAADRAGDRHRERGGRGGGGGLRLPEPSATPGASGAAGLDELRGRKARVLVDCARGQRGKIRVQLKGHQVDVLATTDEERIAEGAEVVIVDVREGVAHVATGGSRKGMA